MRGYRMLQETGQLEWVTKIRDEISRTKLDETAGLTNSFFFGAANDRAELVLRQYLLTRFVSYDFAIKLLRALGDGTKRIRHPLPKAWRKVVERYGIKANTFQNRFEWVWAVIKYCCFGVIVFVRLLGGEIKGLFSKPGTDQSGYAFFDGLTAKNLPQQTNHTSYDIFNWYDQWNGKAEVEVLYHTIRAAGTSTVNQTPIVPVPGGMIASGSFRAMLRFLLWGAAAFFLALSDMIRGRYLHAVMLGEAAKAAQVRGLKDDALAKDYLFHNSHWMYRPLWTYDAERKGSRIIFYFYSTNVESLKTKTGYPLQAYCWHVLSWPYYLVWDEWQRDFVRRAVGDQPKVDVVGSIWFMPGKAKELTIPENSVVVFDINPLRDTRYAMFVESPRYLVPEVINPFLLDIYQAAREQDLTMVLKRKREIGSMLNKSNRRLIDTLATKDHFQSVDVDIPAQLLIRKAKLVISVPFTSTALIARDMNKPSCFYDPSGIIQADDRAAHGIPVITGIEALREWIAHELKNDAIATND